MRQPEWMRRDAARQVSVAHLFEPGGRDHARKGLLIGEAADALDQIFVCLAVAGDALAEPGHHR